MSRIHEALKKAAQERVAQLGTRGAESTAVASPNDLAPEILEGLSEPVARAANSPSEPGLKYDFDQFASRCPHPDWRIDSRTDVFSGEMMAPDVVERFVTLRSRLYQVAAVQPLRRILISSSLPMEGKTFVASNLAHAFSRQSDRRVLLIDADIRAPRLHLSFGARNTPGLSDYLLGDVNELQVTQVGPTGNLCLIPAGKATKDPGELLHRSRMKELLDNMSQLFDWVVIDSPPALAVHDASLLADICDGVLFVVRAGATDFEIAEKAASEFQGKNLLGVVLNRVEKSDAYHSYYYSYSSKERGTSGNI
ncbi:MAG TPA: CpsD/CapB family tyrosine-protein kinase [Methylomirabilota bacterium]|nr:CpsD/CapB family tyrosine-protein kinase [Methylomirabilota bacterium]